MNMFLPDTHIPEINLWNAIVDLAVFDINKMAEYLSDKNKYYRAETVKGLIENYNSAYVFFKMFSENNIKRTINPDKLLEVLHFVNCHKCKKHKIIGKDTMKVYKNCKCLVLL